jgi:stage III sporulation protein SpoIIIAA
VNQDHKPRVSKIAEPSSLRITDNLELLLEIFPPGLKRALEPLEGELLDLIEVVLDLGRQPQARFPGKFVFLASDGVTREDLKYVTDRLSPFGRDNRAGIERTLHRISAIRNRLGECVGLTCRVGRAVYGTEHVIRDVVETGKSILLLGRPGVGKTTLLREVARVMADELLKRVVIVDTSNEIAGDGDIPHSGIGMARRMQVPQNVEQHAVMIEAVENHMPEVVVVDEIGTEAESYAARTIAERGVTLVATAHGNTLENLMMNPTLSDLVGGIHSVTISDEEARRRSTQKTIQERKAPPCFDVVIEIQDKQTFVIHENVASTVDLMLRGQPVKPEIRVRKDGEVEIVQTSNREFLEYAGESGGRRDGRAKPDQSPRPTATRSSHEPQLNPKPSRVRDADPQFQKFFGDNTDEEQLEVKGEADTDYPLAPPPPGHEMIQGVKIFPYSISRNRLERAIAMLGVEAQIVRSWEVADIVITLKEQLQNRAFKFEELRRRHIPIHLSRSNTVTQLQLLLKQYFQLTHLTDKELAMREVEFAAKRVQKSPRDLDLTPQDSDIRKLQHDYLETLGLRSRSFGPEPHRFVRILGSRNPS